MNNNNFKEVYYCNARSDSCRLLVSSCTGLVTLFLLQQDLLRPGGPCGKHKQLPPHCLMIVVIPLIRSETTQNLKGNLNFFLPDMQGKHAVMVAVQLSISIQLEWGFCPFVVNEGFAFVLEPNFQSFHLLGIFSWQDSMFCYICENV